MTKKEEAILEINEAQDYYVSQLADIITGSDNRFSELKEIDFTSATGTGKTIMVAKLINKFPDYFFFITTLSRGQLRVQIERKVSSYCPLNNFVVFGLNEYTKTSIIKEDDILKLIPSNKKLIWIRDEGHIATNRWQEILRTRSLFIVNFSATNKGNNGINCNFTHTMMLRTVSQNMGTPGEALDKLCSIKKIHENIKEYNPCALFRIIHDENLPLIIEECRKRNLSYINITDEEYDMSEICQDNNDIDVIINKFKITEGIDLKRCHVIYMDSKPSNEATVVQVIGRARRNALFWRNDIDILSKQNVELLNETRKCFVFYNVPNTEVAQNETGELSYTLCDTISIEALRPNIRIRVTKGQLQNGLFVIELWNKTGFFNISYDDKLNANVVANDDFYQEKRIDNTEQYCLDLSLKNWNVRRVFLKDDFLSFFLQEDKVIIDEHKETFFLIKLLLEQKPSVMDIDIEYWENFLEAKNVYCFISEDKWKIFADNNLQYFGKLYRNLMDFRNAITDEEFKKAESYAQTRVAVKPLERKNIIQRVGIICDFTSEFSKYIDSIEFNDFDLFYKIKDILFSYKNVMQHSVNEYIYSPHPFTNYLLKRGLSTIEAIEQKINEASNQVFLKCPIIYWKKMLKEINTFNDIDSYDIKKVNFHELIKILNLNITEEEESQYVSGIYKIRRRKTSNMIITKISSRTKIVTYDRDPKIFAYRADFERKYVHFEKTINDYEIGVIGPDTMKYANHHYIEDMPVTSKIEKFCKFNKFITSKYQDVLNKTFKKCFNGKNVFNFDPKCNSCLGYCVEYYAKIKLYGETYYSKYIALACSEAKTYAINNSILVRAAMLIYKEEMTKCYGPAMPSIIQNISISSLVSQKFETFVKTVVELGNKTYKYVLNKMYGGHIDSKTSLYDPNLSVNHISALADFISKDMIIDLKCTSSICLKHVKQVLAYHYLSTKRSDLDIKRLVIFDVPTGKSLEIDLSNLYNKQN